MVTKAEREALDDCGQWLQPWGLFVRYGMSLSPKFACSWGSPVPYLV